MKVKRTVTEVKCDVCMVGDGEPVENYTIGLPDTRPVRVDLCRVHARPLVELAGKSVPIRHRDRKAVVDVADIKAARRTRR